jgi:Ig-like domain-containing protein
MKNVKEIILPKTLLKIASLVCLTLLALTACSPASPVTISLTAGSTATKEARIAGREAQVQSIDIQIMNADPTQVNAVVRGNLTESCAILGESQVQYTSNTIQIIVYAVSPSDIGCMQVTTSFETTIPLNISDLPAGSYTVVANGVSTVLNLPVENSVSTPVPTFTVTSTNEACVDSGTFVVDVTIPDNTIVVPNTAFTKTWRLKNTGSCTWDSSYSVSYISGTTVSQQPGYWIVQQGQTVAPGQMVDVSVGMTSPVEDGNYQSYWGLKKEDGPLMPIQGGANGDSFYVKIKVNNGTAVGRITAQSISIEPEQGSGTVCTANSTYFVHANITADGPTSATYEIGSTAGQIAAGNFQTSPTGPISPVVTGTLIFDQADTQTIKVRFVGPYPYPSDITINLRVNGGEWYSTKLSCQ